MTIGNHLLSGQLIKLEKPLAILEKDEAAIFNPSHDSPTGLPVKYHIKGIIHHKILFNTRPRVLQQEKIESSEQTS